ncbi:WxcM-like domain-containing protein [Flavobacteriaceae bacterium]|nr:WxcM-like domain-containing protein [Flavobacteriaceae bacterium]
MSKPTPHLISGKNYIDERGELKFYNDFDMSSIKRMYFTTNLNTKVIRAWQGHTIQSRWFCSVKGSFLVKLIKIDNWENPSEELPVLKYKLSSKRKEILFIPSGYVNGFKALQSDSKLMIMSNYDFSETENDEFRYDKNKWTEWDN